MPTVSVVVPVYNMENYIERCVASLTGQTLKDIEVILVDDGSKDTSGKKCDDIALYYPGVTVIHQKNKGLTGAWKAGSLAAKGDYIGYVDADDTVDADMFERLYTRAKETDADIVCCGLVHTYEDGSREDWTEQMEFDGDSFAGEELKKQILDKLINDGSFFGRPLMPNRVTKLTRRELVQKNLPLCNDEVSIGEDFQFSLCMFLDAERVEIIRDYFPYHYIMQNASMTMHHDPDYMQKIRIMRKNLCRIAREKEAAFLEQQIWNDFLCLTVLHVKAIIYKQKDKPYRHLKQEMKKVLTSRSVSWALWHYDMPRLTAAEKLFIFFMKTQAYPAIYAAVRAYFR
ncbi:MAG: glycosyltransferase family 2 protein [Lachnospiraceae bacterium]|nr:glycosyltransferase family 2 protein [Lachnospiraceae bacterium]